MHVAYEVEFSDEFGDWWDGLTSAEQKSVDFTVGLLQQVGPRTKNAAFLGDRDLSQQAYARAANSTLRAAVPGPLCV